LMPYLDSVLEVMNTLVRTDELFLKEPETFTHVPLALRLRFSLPGIRS
jgi:hypothetical protein